jgi:hypothetical protein
MLAHLLAAWVVRHGVCGFAFFENRKNLFVSGLFPLVTNTHMQSRSSGRSLSGEQSEPDKLRQNSYFACVSSFFSCK